MLNFQHLGLLCCWEIPWPVLTKGSFQSLGPQPSALARPLTPDPLRLSRPPCQVELGGSGGSGDGHGPESVSPGLSHLGHSWSLSPGWGGGAQPSRFFFLVCGRGATATSQVTREGHAREHVLGPPPATPWSPPRVDVPQPLAVAQARICPGSLCGQRCHLPHRVGFSWRERN